MTLDKIYDDNKFDLEDSKKFREQIENIVKQGNYKYIFDSNISYASELINFYWINGIEFYDSSNNNVNFNTDILEYFKYLNKHSSNSFIRYEYKYLSYEMFKKGDILLSMIGMSYSGGPHILRWQNAIANELTSQNIKVFHYPTDKIIAKANECIAINKNSQSKQNAYNFMKIVLSEEVQKKSTNLLPINNLALESMYNDARDEYERLSFFIDWPVINIRLPESVIEDYNNIINSITDCTIMDYTIMDLIKEPFDKFMADEYTNEEAAREMEKKVRLYLDE